MITKGIIEKIDSSVKGSVDFHVRMPLFETANDNSPFIMIAKLCYQPGNLEGFYEGDVVYVGFENEYLNRPVILGKLYKGNEKTLFLESEDQLDEDSKFKQNATNFSYNSSLEVVHNAVLPINTKIGDLTYENIYDIYKTYDEQKDLLNQLKNRVTHLENIVCGLKIATVDDLRKIINSDSDSD